jgi:putative hydrolase of the HAD superfamily
MGWRKRKYSLLLFDLDHTLWDLETNAKAAVHDIFTELKLGQQISNFDLFYDTYKVHNQRLWLEYEQGNLKKERLRTLRFHLTLTDFGVNNLEQAAYFGEKYIRLCPTKTALFPDALKTLDYLQPKYQLAIVTNGFAEVQQVKMAACGLDKYFQRLFISEQVGRPKPHPDIFHAAVTAFHASKKSSLMIGDNWHNDIEGAQKYGIDQVFYNPNLLPHPGKPTFEISRLEELIGFL